MYGRRVASFDRLTLADRERLVSARKHASIIERLSRKLSQSTSESQAGDPLRSSAIRSSAEAAEPKEQSAQQRSSRRSGSRGGAEWLFAFCVEALNDARMDEVAISDYLMRLSASQKFFTPHPRSPH